MSSELLPCYCGDEPCIKSMHHGFDGYTSYKVYCPTVGCLEQNVWFADRDAAIESWNEVAQANLHRCADFFEKTAENIRECKKQDAESYMEQVDGR